MRYLATFNIDEMLEKWEYCPLCGGELTEVYPGDFVGHLNCLECDGEGFDIIGQHGDEYYSMHPKRRRLQ